jgi:phosphomannomutase
VDLSSVRRLRVVVDAGNGMAGLTVPAVLGTATGLGALPIDVVPLYFELDGAFPHHEANPIDPANLVDLQEAVVRHRADLGLAFDGDADRCFVVDERGERVDPSTVTALVGLRLAARDDVAGRRPIVLYNAITSRAVPEILDAHGVRAVRTRVGHSFIKATMAEHQAVFGGEHSGHYYFRDFFGADSGMLAAMHILAALGDQPEPMSRLVAGLDPYVRSGEVNVRVDDTAAALARVLAALTERTTPEGGALDVDRLDGLTVSCWRDEQWWLNLRPSHTEPLLRLNVEAVDEAVMGRVRDQVLTVLAAPCIDGAPTAPAERGA